MDDICYKPHEAKMPNGPMLIINNILDTFTETIRIRRVFIIIFIYLKSVTPKIVHDSQY